MKKRKTKFEQELHSIHSICLNKKDAEQTTSLVMKLLNAYNFREEQLYEKKGYREW